ncbi:MAG TPA: WD40 repeat domain-containing protein, partial [Pirellulales bacterium]|nr:WD40 repeat domain-containing protein [Pirellulales bacterium]
TSAEGFDVPLPKRPWIARFSPDGRWLAIVEAAVGDDSGSLVMIDVKSAQMVWEAAVQPPPPTYYRGFECSPWPIEFDGDSREVLVSLSDRSLVGIDVRTGRQTRTYLPASDAPIARIQRMPDGRHVFVARLNPERFVVDCRSGETSTLRFERDIFRFGMCRTARGDLWLLNSLATRQNFLTASEAADATVVLDDCAERTVFSAAVSPDGQYLALGGEGRIIYCWDLVGGGRVKKFVGHEGIIVDLTFSPDGRTILSHGADEMVRLWHVTTGAELLRLGTPDERITCMGLNPVGDLLVLGVERDGRYGLQLHRLRKNRNALPKTIAGPPPKAAGR